MIKTKNTLKSSLWVEQYADQLYKYALKRISNTETAKDLVQDTFLSALKNKDTFKGEISEKNWLYTILKNKIIDFYRNRARLLISSLNEHSAKINDYFDEDENWQESAKPKQWALDYSQNIEKKEFYEILEKCKNKLSELQNIVFTMKHLDETDSDEICKELNISSSNYWTLMHRAKLQLRQCLENNWFKK